MAVNLENVESADQSGGKSLVPEGIYPFRVIEGEEIAGSGGKNAQHLFKLAIQHGKHEGRQVYLYFSLSEGHKSYLKLFYEKIGATDMANLSPDEWNGKAVRCEVEHDEWNGKTNAKIRLGSYYDWDGKEDTAWGAEGDPNKVAKAPSTAPLFSNGPKDPVASSDGEPPF